MSDDLDLVGSEEAARIAGISARAIRQHHHRGTMPATIPVAGSDVLVWRRDTIEQWAATRPGPGRPTGVTMPTYECDRCGDRYVPDRPRRGEHRHLVQCGRCGATLHVDRLEATDPPVTAP